jgi:hypothetical protein
MAITSSFSFRVGEDAGIDVQVTPAQDISDWTLIFNAVLCGGGGATAAALKYTASPGIRITNGPAGQLRVTIASADTLGLTPGMYAWEVRRIDSGNNSVEADGVFYLLPSTVVFD